MCHRVRVGRSRRPCALGCRGSPSREKCSRGAHGHAGREARPARRRCCGGLPSRPLCDRRPAAAVRAPSGPGCRRTPPRCRTDSPDRAAGRTRGPAERPSGAGCPAESCRAVRRSRDFTSVAYLREHGPGRPVAGAERSRRAVDDLRVAMANQARPALRVHRLPPMVSCFRAFGSHVSLSEAHESRIAHMAQVT